MAVLIPALASCLSRMTSGEKRLAERQEHKLDGDYLLWYDVPVGPKQTHPDFVVTSLVPWPGDFVCGERRYMEGEVEKRAAIFIVPEFGTVSRPHLVAAAREAADAPFERAGVEHWYMAQILGLAAVRVVAEGTGSQHVSG